MHVLKRHPRNAPQPMTWLAHNQLIISRLEYECLIWSSCQVYDANEYETVPSRSTGFVHSLNLYDITVSTVSFFLFSARSHSFRFASSSHISPYYAVLSKYTYTFGLIFILSSFKLERRLPPQYCHRLPTNPVRKCSLSYDTTKTHSTTIFYS